MRVKLFVLILLVICCIISCSKKTTEVVTNTVAAPTFSIEPGAYMTAQTVTLVCTTEESTIRYTLNGATPDTSSYIYTAPILIDSTKVITARAYRTGWTPSPVVTASYTIPVPPPEMILVEGGVFNMGNELNNDYENELPVHQVTLSSYYIGTHEINQSEWIAVMGSNPAATPNINKPVEKVSWYSILAYCNKLSIQEGLTPVYSINGLTNPTSWGNIPTSNNLVWNAAVCNWSADGYRLPTEAEWEFAAKGGTPTQSFIYSGGDDLSLVGWYSGNSGAVTQRGSLKQANTLGLFDMSGNVWEFCWDLYGTYASWNQTNPTGAFSGITRIVRGGSWYSSEEYCRVSARGYQYPHLKDNGIGFRVCRRVP